MLLQGCMFTRILRKPFFMCRNFFYKKFWLFFYGIFYTFASWIVVAFPIVSSANKSALLKCFPLIDVRRLSY